MRSASAGMHLRDDTAWFVPCLIDDFAGRVEGESHPAEEGDGDRVKDECDRDETEEDTLLLGGLYAVGQGARDESGGGDGSSMVGAHVCAPCRCRPF